MVAEVRVKGLSPSDGQVLAHMLGDHRFIFPFPLCFLHITAFTKEALIGLVSKTNAHAELKSMKTNKT